MHYAGLEPGLRTDKITTDNFVYTAGLRGNLGELAITLRPGSGKAGSATARMIAMSAWAES